MDCVECWDCNHRKVPTESRAQMNFPEGTVDYKRDNGAQYDYFGSLTKLSPIVSRF